jgi:hypothetical protein
MEAAPSLLIARGGLPAVIAGHPCGFRAENGRLNAAKCRKSEIPDIFLMVAR